MSALSAEATNLNWLLDSFCEPASLELGQEPELPELVERRHSSEIRARPSSVSGSSAASAS